jgi:hypothetical protein
VTLDDLIATIGEQLDNVADTIEVQSPEYSPQQPSESSVAELNNPISRVSDWRMK